MIGCESGVALQVFELLATYLTEETIAMLRAYVKEKSRRDYSPWSRLSSKTKKEEEKEEEEEAPVA